VHKRQLIKIILIVASPLFKDCLDPDDGGSKLLINISNYLITDNASKPKDMNLYETHYDNTKPHTSPWFTN
jgi:hypothetical protein